MAIEIGGTGGIARPIEETLKGTIYAPSPKDDSGGGGGGPSQTSAEDILNAQIAWLENYATSTPEELYQQYGAYQTWTEFEANDYLPLEHAGFMFSENQVEESAMLDQLFSESGSGFLTDQGGGGGGGGGGGRAPSDAKFSAADITIPGAPSWWQAMVPNVTNPISAYQTLTNLMIPMLSPEDQRTAASNLFQSAPDQFTSYDPELLELAPAPETITADVRQQYFSGDRAQKTLDAFDRLLEVSGKTAEDFGPGYNYLRGLADTLQDFKLTSGATQLTETQQGRLLGALDPQLAQSKGTGALGAYGAISRSFANPFFSAGSLTGQVKTDFGQIINPPNPAYR